MARRNSWGQWNSPGKIKGTCTQPFTAETPRLRGESSGYCQNKKRSLVPTARHLLSEKLLIRRSHKNPRDASERGWAQRHENYRVAHIAGP